MGKWGSSVEVKSESGRAILDSVAKWVAERGGGGDGGGTADDAAEAGAPAAKRAKPTE